ncbi:MAG: SIR2 family protein [Candidatus Acidiferrum sp.]
MTIEKTYFVGAGASKAFCPSLPLASEATLEFLLDLRGPESSLDQAADNVKRYMVDQRWSKDKHLAIFEKVYLEFPEKLEPFYPRENLLLCLCEKLRLPDNVGGPGAWVRACLDSNHPVLTTNYDTLIEWQVENFGSTSHLFGNSGILDYGVPDRLCVPLASADPERGGMNNKLLLLKLYGSVSWSRCDENACRKYLLDAVYEHGARAAITGRGKCPSCEGTRRDAVFVPLVGQKSPNDTALKAIWKEAERVLSESREIIFAGFSLSPDDQNIRDLLKRALADGHTSKVTVVLHRRDPETIERYREIYGDRMESYESGWVEYLRERNLARSSRY